MNGMNKLQKSRANDIDLVKAIAIVCVLIIHSCRYTAPVMSFNWISTVFWGSVSRSAVPLFFMCSGVIFLDPERKLTVKKLYFKYILRIVVALFFWAMTYKVYILISDGRFSPSELVVAVKELFLFKHYTHFYYLHIIILFYALMPIVRVFTKNASRTELRYALILWFAVGILYPTLSPYWPFTLLSGMPKQWLLNMTWASVGYGLLGYYLKKYPISLKLSLPSLLSGFAVIFGGTLYFSHIKGSLDARFFEGMTVGVMLLAVGVFSIAGAISKKMGNILLSTTQYVSKGSFCVYLIHLILWDRLVRAGIFPDSLPIILIPLIAIGILLVCLLIYFILSKVPIVNKWLI